jgi:hypothetical protein
LSLIWQLRGLAQKGKGTSVGASMVERIIISEQKVKKKKSFFL